MGQLLEVREPALTAGDTPIAPGSRHLSYIDGIRGLSAVYVMLFHMYQFASTRVTGVPPRWWAVMSVLQYGDCGVAVFIVVSGYCLMLPVVATPDLRLKGGRLGFAQRRLRRLGPGYVAAIVGTVILIVVVPSMRHDTGSMWDGALPALSFSVLAAHALLIFNWSRGWEFKIDPSAWTVALEVQIYAVFVLVLLPVWRRCDGRRANALVPALCGALTLLLMSFGLGWAHPWMLLLFALGMCAAAASQRTLPFMRGRVDLFVVLALAAIPAALMVERHVFHSLVQEEFFREVVVGIATVTLLLGLRQTTGPGDGRMTRWLGRVFSGRMVTWLGRISYSLYLVHFPVIGAVALTWIYPRGDSEPVTFALILVFGGGASLLVAEVFHLLFEKRYLTRRDTAGRAAIPIERVTT